MILLDDSAGDLGGVLLPVAAGLLLEELTLGGLARLLLAPYFVNYHLEHHLLTAMPCYRLPTMHRLLAAKGVMENCEVQPDYGTVLRLATTRQAEPAARAPRTHGRTFHG